VHGWANTSEKLFVLTNELIAHNYRVLLVNTRNHGESDMDGYSTMLKFSEDLMSAIKYIQQIYTDEKRVVLLGHSLGAASSLYLCSKNQMIRAVVAISGFADLRNMLMVSFSKYKFPSWLISIIIKYLEYKIGEKTENLSPHNSIKKIKVPVLLVHGKKDEIVPVDDFEKLRKQANKELLSSELFLNENHSSILNSKHLFQSVLQFLKKSFD